MDDYSSRYFSYIFPRGIVVKSIIKTDGSDPTDKDFELVRTQLIVRAAYSEIKCICENLFDSVNEEACRWKNRRKTKYFNKLEASKISKHLFRLLPNNGFSGLLCQTRSELDGSSVGRLDYARIKSFTFDCSTLAEREQFLSSIHCKSRFDSAYLEAKLENPTFLCSSYLYYSAEHWFEAPTGFFGLSQPAKPTSKDLNKILQIKKVLDKFVNILETHVWEGYSNHREIKIFRRKINECYKLVYKIGKKRLALSLSRPVKTWLYKPVCKDGTVGVLPRLEYAKSLKLTM